MERVNFTSVWDDDAVDITVTASYDKETGKVFDIDSVEVNGLDILEREFITTDEGKELLVLDFDNFQEKWLEQECDKCEDKKQLMEEIGEAGDFEDLFRVIGLWSHSPLAERVKIFLERNNACYKED